MATALASGAVLAGAIWLREPRVLYLAAHALATLGLLALLARRAARGGRGLRVPTLLFAVGSAAFTGVAALAEREVARLEGNGADALAERRAGALAELAADADRLARWAQESAGRAADAAAGVAVDADSVPVRRQLFDRLAGLAGGAPERAVVVLRGGRPLAWAGTHRVSPDSLPDGVGVFRTPLYAVLHASVRRGGDRAIATALLHAAPPADGVARALDRGLVRRHGLSRLEFAVAEAEAVRGARRAELGLAPLPAESAWRTLPLAGAGAAEPPLVRALTPTVAEARQRAIADARRIGTPAVLLLTIVLLAAVWRSTDRLRHRLATLAVPLAVIAVAPLNALSGTSPLFDPALYFARIGWRFTASVGALAATCATVLLGLFALLRARARPAPRPVAAFAVATVALGGPFVLRALSRGIAPPALGVPLGVWVGWQVGLFLAASAILVTGAAAGRAALPRGRGLHPLVAPVLAGGAAMAAPALWRAPFGWPEWYPALWIAAIAALALTRRTAAVLVAATAVAGLGAATLVWSATVRSRVELAVREVQALASPEADATTFAERLGRRLAADAALRDAPFTVAGLLRRFAESPLAAAGFPVALSTWVPAADGDSLVARVGTTTWRVDSLQLRAVLAAARADTAPAIRAVAARPGIAIVLTVPHPSGWVAAVTVFPRTRVFADDPATTLLGLPRGTGEEPPYTVSLLGRVARPDASPARVAEAAGLASLTPRWARTEDELHGDWLLPLPDGWTRVHVEVALRPLDVLVQRGALLTLLDLLVVGALWSLPAMADGAGRRWWRWWTGAWRRSFRSRLTVALFAFFAVPTSAFAIWSYRQLQAGDRQLRALLITEALRGAAAEDPDAPAGSERPLVSNAPVERWLGASAARFATTLLAYDGGLLVRASDPAVLALAPFGRLLPPALMLGVGLGEEVTDSRVLRIGERAALVGFRARVVPGGSRLVLAAPAREDDVALAQRRRDLGFLVVLAAAGGALAALWLSGVAARQLSRPVGALQSAALVIAGGARAGEREPAGRSPALGGAALTAALAGEPPTEFRPVFQAVRRMAADLDASREALDAARRRTAAVLRDVASGVVACDEDGVVTLANPRAEALLERALAPGVPLEETAPPGLAVRLRAFRDGAAAEEEFDVELHGRHLRARLTRLGAHGSGAAPALGGEGDARGAVLTLDDMTELTRAQRVLAWGEMARQVAHEIKNPLTPIRLGVQHLRRAYRDGRSDFDAILERNVERVLAEIDRLDEIARAFSRYGTAPADGPPPVPVDVAAVARDVVALERLGQGSVAWELDGAELPCPARAREDELREVLLNLLENARLANARRVRVEVGGDGEWVRLRVADDGDGIPDDVLPRIFEPHFSTRTSGSGLGLAISRRLVERWGGTIAVESRRGSGTTLTVALRAG